MTSRILAALLVAAEGYNKVCTSSGGTLTQAQVNTVMGGDWSDAKVVEDALDCLSTLAIMQSTKHGEVKRMRKDIASNLISSISQASSGFSAKKMQINADADTLKGEAQRLSQQLKNAKDRYNQQMQQMRSAVDGVRDGQVEAVQGEKESIRAYFTKLRNDVASQKNQVLGDDAANSANNPVTQLVNARQSEATGRLTALNTKIDKLNTESTEAVAEFEGEVKEDSTTVENMISGFNTALQQSENKLGELKGDVDEQSGKTTTLMENLDEEVKKRETALEEVAETAKLKDEQFIQSMEQGTLATAQEQLAGFSTTAQGKTDQYIANLNTATQTLEADVQAKINTLATKKDQFDTELETKLAAAEGRIGTLTDELVAEADREKAFPRKAENELSKLETEAMDQFNDVRQGSINYFKDLNTEYLQKAKDLGTESIEALDGQVTRYVDEDKKQAADAERASQQAATSAIDDLIEKRTALAAVQENIGGLNEQANGVDSRIKRLDTQIQRTGDSVAAQAEANRKKIELDAKKVSVAAKKELSKMKRKITSAHKSANKVLSRAEKEMTNDFENTARKLQRKLDKELTRTRAGSQKVEDLGKRMTDKMSLKTADIERKIGVVLKALPKVNADVTLFKTTANAGIGEMETEATTAMGNADAVVDTYLTNLRDAAAAAVKATKDSVTPLERANQQKLSDAKSHFQTAVSEIRNTTKGYVDAATDALLEADQKVRENNVSIEEFPQNLDDAYQLADENATNAFNDLKHAIESQQGQLLTEEGTLGNEVDGAVQAVKTRATEDMNAADAALEEELTRASTVVGKHLMSLKQVEAQGKSLEHKADHLDRHAMVLHGMLKEAEQRAKTQKAQVESETEQLSEDSDAQTKAAEDARADIESHLDNVANAAKAAGDKAVSEAGADINTAVNDGRQQAGESVAGASRTVEENGQKGNSEINSFEQTADKEITGADKTVNSLEGDIRSEEKRERKTQEEIHATSQEINELLVAQSSAFEEEMTQLGEQLKAAVGGDAAKLQQLTDVLDNIQTETKQAVETQSNEDTVFLSNLITEARSELQKVQTRVEEAEGKANQFATQVAEESTAVDDSMANAESVSGAYKQKVADVKREYVEKLGEERRSRQTQVGQITNQMQNEFKKSWEMMREVERVGTGPMGIIGPAFDLKIGKLNLAEEKMDRQLRESLNLEHYQDESKLKEVASVIDNAKAEEAKITTWREGTEKAQKAFQEMVVASFRKLGVMVDLSELDMARAKAEEEWAVQEQMRHLKTALGDQMRDLSDVAEQRLAALAARSGKEIAELMKNEELTAEERAAALAKIKEAARQRSQEIVEQDGHMKLEQDTMSRKLTIAGDEVEQFMSRIASLEGHAAPGGQLKKVMGRIKTLLDEANEKTAGLGAPPAALAELGDASAEKEAELQAGLHVLQDGDAAGLLKVASEESERMIREDQSWKGELAQLPHALS